MQGAATKQSGDELSGKQSKVLALLVSGATIEAAAKAGAINPATIHQWLKRPQFVESYKAARRDVVTQATASLQAACGEAVSTLRAVASDIDAPASSRVSAARTILELAYRAVELDDLAGRIEALENAQESKQKESGQRWQQ
jgi:hypothetical protein